MKTVSIQPPQLPEDSAPVTIGLPLSKSESNRRLVLDCLAGVDTRRSDVAACDDTDAMIDALARRLQGDTYINIGAAGTAMRFLAALLAATPGPAVTIDGSERMRRRPIGPLADALRSLGADVASGGEDGYPPLVITGRRLRGGDVEMSGSVSSQYISALMMVAPVMERGLHLTLRPPVVSRPYIDMTARMLATYGADVAVDADPSGGLDIRVAPGRLTAPAPASVEADWSAASYWYEVAALTGRRFDLRGLRRDSLQGDAAVAGLFSRIEEARRAPGGVLRLDLSATPDLAQTLVATCCALGVRFRFDGLSTLPVKETDRLAALRCELARLGFELDVIGGEALAWDGARCEAMPDPIIRTYNDHRMAMAFAPLAVRFPGLRIEDPDVVSKSYPGFWTDLARAGFKLSFL